MKTIILDGGKFKGKETVHSYLKEMFRFPEYYGNNLDALMDCLTDLDEMEITITNADMSDPYTKKVMKVFQRAQQEGEIILHIK